MISRRSFVLGAAATAAARPAFAQSFPSKPITIVVPYPPGGPTDLMARAIAEVMAERLRQNVIVDNRPGGGGQVAGAAYSKAPADGYTLFLGDVGTLAVGVSIVSKSNWQPTKDVVGVASMLQMPMLLLVPKSSPYNSLSELIAASKTKELTFASQGIGSGGHLLGEMLQDATRGKFVHVAYKGSAPAVSDLLGGQVDLLFDGVPAGLQHIRADKLKALAVAAPTRTPLLPQIATTAEQGIKGVSFPIWFGMVTRAQTPEAIVAQLHAEVNAAMSNPKVLNRFVDLGFERINMSSDDFNNFLRTESQKWDEFVKARNIRAD